MTTSILSMVRFDPAKDRARQCPRMSAWAIRAAVTRYTRVKRQENDMAADAEQRKLHFDLTNVGLRAQATAAGLVQLCRELESAGVIDQAALTRIKRAIADDIMITAPRSVRKEQFRGEICSRLDGIFSGEQKLGGAEKMAFASEGALVDPEAG
jgi:hypothetical protein